MDDLLTYKPGTIDWLIHPNPGLLTASGKDLVINTGEDKLTIKVLNPEQYNLEKMSGYEEEPQNTWNSAEPLPVRAYYSIKFNQSTKAEKIIIVFVPSTCNHVKLDKVSEQNLAGIKISDNKHVKYLLYNILADGRTTHDNSWIKYGEIWTDALIFGYDEPGATREFYSMHAGSMLRAGDRIILNCLSKIDGVVEYTKNFVHAELVTSRETDIGIGSEKKPATVSLNGKKTSYRHDGGLVRLKSVKGKNNICIRQKT